MEWVLPSEVIIITRTDLLKYILTCNPKTKRDPNIEKYIDQIKSQYPVVEKVETMFKEFHALWGKTKQNWMNIWESMVRVR